MLKENQRTIIVDTINGMKELTVSGGKCIYMASGVRGPQGEKGDKGDRGETGQTGATGNGIEKITFVGVVGRTRTYRIDYTNGGHFDYILLDGETGATGATGNGISGIELISEVGKAKTYRIEYTDGNHFDFVVTDGEDGTDGTDGQDGTDGITPVVEVTTITGGHNVAFDYGTGDPRNTDFDVMDGQDGASSWGAITGDLSDQTDLAAALADKADVITRSVSADIVSIADGAPAPVKGLTVGIDAVQDLHGYANPWPAGGGVNIWDEETESGSLSTITGEETTSSSIIRCKNFVPVTAGYTYYVVTSTQYGIWVLFYDSNKQVVTTDIPSGASSANYARRYDNTYKIIIPAETTIAYIRWYFRSEYGTTYKHDTSINYPSTATAYAPYSNVCPISGWTEAKVTRTGKNLLEAKFYNGIGYNKAVGSVITLTELSDVTKSGDTYSRTVGSWGAIEMVSPRLVLGTYKLTCTLTSTSMRSSIYVLNSDMTVSRNLGNQASGTSRTVTNTITLSGNEAYIAFVCCSSSAGTVSVTEPMIENGTSATAYEAPNITSVTIDLDGTRYGGMLDVLSGTLTVTHIGGRLGAEGWTKSSTYLGGYYHSLGSVPIGDNTYHCKASGILLCSHAKTVTSLGEYVYGTCYRDSALNIRIMPENSTLTDWQNYLTNNNVQMVLELATPLTIALEPATLTMLKGDNTLWADCGAVDVTYRADTRTYIDNAISDSANAIRLMLTPNVEQEMKASKNYTSGAIIVVGNDFLKATSNISNGTTLTIGSNVAKTTIAEWVASLTA